jgi:hypothetical protein
MKALSIRQPYAWAIVAGYKDVENRDWLTHFRGRVLIHAGKRQEVGDVDGVIRSVAVQTRRTDAEVATEYGEHLQAGGLGAIVGAATISDCVQNMESEWFYGKYGFVMTDPKAIRPLPCKGALSFFSVPADVAEAIRAITPPETSDD